MTGINISEKMDELQAFMEAQRHIRNDGKFLRMLDEFRRNWDLLSDSDAAYVEAARDTFEYKWQWDHRER